MDFHDNGRAVCYSNDYHNVSTFRFDVARERVRRARGSTFRTKKLCTSRRSALPNWRNT
ncbi:hypothetical protein BN2475_420097 [Paraburkholderia ribeironis]|uniref:Uncharacterized protein n=1 Tax=Paraburkholderia ribeironis TaxID=1247936 RepID=A0A1N7S7X9_9BURK|nr:hypothetical protein BN2475_420097 [Paraburkholderia ribeironis]